jgi:hypothetical protein
MQESELELDSFHRETDYSDLPDLISVSDDGEDDNDDIRSKTFQIFSRLSVFNFGLQKVTNDIDNLRKDAADITVLMQHLCLLLSNRTSGGENIVLNMEENSDEGELCCEHFSSPLYAKIPSQEKRFYLEDDEQEDNDEEEEEDHDDNSEEEDIHFSDDNEDEEAEDVDDDPNGLGESTIFD